MRFRNLLAVVMAYLVALCGVEPVALGQYGAPAPQNYPAQSYPAPQYPQQQYPAAGQYPAPSGQYPNTGQYPAAPYPNSGNPNAAYAQQNDQSQDGAALDPAIDGQHGVARLSIAQGDVNVKRGDNGELVAAVINAPLMAQDRLQTSPGSRAEIELDAANVIRLAPNTDLGFADLEYHRYQVQLGAGAIIYRVLRASNVQAEVDTPAIAFHPLAPGEYRVSVTDDGQTQISVRSGSGEIFSPRGSQHVDAGRSVVVRGNPADPEFQQAFEAPRDQFDEWSDTRDRDMLGSQSVRYVSADVYGADDLDRYGNWVPSQYGQVWAPQAQQDDWAPYSSGQWTWENYYGWTWVDSAPWGWAPYHYGRWFRNGGYGWCWWPGAVGASVLWSPALVGFFGFGAAVGLGLAGLGWVALAPFELFHSWWGHGGFGFGYGRGYDYGRFGAFRNINVAGMYRNAAFRGAALTAGLNGFGGPHQRFAAATRGQLSNANLFRGQLPVSPTRGSYQFSNRQATFNQRLAGAGQRQFFSHQQPGNRTGAGVNGGTGNYNRGFAGGANQAGNQYGVNQHGVAPNQQGNLAGRSGFSSGANAAAGGWQRFGDPARSTATRQGFASGGQEQSGWHRFGEPHQSTPSNNGGTYSGGAYNRGAYNSGQGSSFGRSYSQPQRGTYTAPYTGGTSYNNSYRSNNYGAERPSYGASQQSHYNAPAQQHFSTPSTPHYSAPSAPHYSSSGSSHGGGGGGSSHGGGGGSHGSGGGGGHSSSGGHHGR